MSVFEFLIIYAMSWWIMFLLVLPRGAYVPELAEGAGYPSAPRNTGIKKKLLFASVISIPLTFIIGWVIYNKVVVRWLESLYM